jgi:TRAP-type C4-dicarboxylate transport system permease small subunit
MTKDGFSKKVMNAFRKVLLFIIAFLTGLNAVTIVLQVIMRYFFKISISWTNELAGISLAWITFLGATLLTADEAHIGMDMIIKKLNPKPRLIIKLIINVLILVVCYVMVKYGAQTVKTGMNSQLITLPATLGQALIIIPISGVMMAVVVIYNSIRDIRVFISSKTTVEMSEEAEAIYDDIPEEVLRRSKEALGDKDIPSDKPNEKDGGDNK